VLASTVGCVLLVLLLGDRSLWTVLVGTCIGLAAGVTSLPFVRSDLPRGEDGTVRWRCRVGHLLRVVAPPVGRGPAAPAR